MAINRTGYTPQFPENEVWFINGSFDTNNTSAPDGLAGQIESVVRDGAGTFTVTMKHWGPSLLQALIDIVTSAGSRVAVKSQTLATNGQCVVELRNNGGTVADSTNETITLTAIMRRTSLTTR